MPIFTLAPSPIPSQIPHTLFDIISLGVDPVLCRNQDTCKTVHTCARSKCISTISWIMSSYLPMTGFRATVCASTVNNRYDCAPTRWGWKYSGGKTWLDTNSVFEHTTHGTQYILRTYLLTLVLGMTLNCMHIFIVTGSFLYWYVMRPVSVFSYTVVFIYESWSYLI